MAVCTVLTSRWFSSQCHFAFVFHMRRPVLLWMFSVYWIAKYNSWEPVSVLEWTLSVMFHGLEYPPPAAPVATPSSRHCGAITGHPMSARQYCPTCHAVLFRCSWSVDGWECSIRPVCQIYCMLCVQSLYSMPSHNDELSLWSAVPNHSCQQTQPVCRPCKAICLGSPTNFCPWACYKNSSLTMHHRDVSSWEQFCIPMEEGGFAPTNCHKTVRHSMTTESCWLQPVRHGSMRGAKAIYLSQAWHPHVQKCGYLLTSTWLVRSIIFSILNCGGQAAFVTSGRCCLHMNLGIGLPTRDVPV